MHSGRIAPSVLNWVNAINTTDLYLSVITLLELEKGILGIERRDVRQGKVLRIWLEAQVIPAFEGRMLPVDVQVARCCAAMYVPDPRPEGDALIAATALINQMTLVTRNTRDFEGLGVTTINPWN